MGFKEKLLILMDRKGVNQEWLAAECGKSQSTVSGWVNGAAPHKKTIVRVAEIFGIPFECLLDDSKELPPWEPPRKAKQIYPPKFIEHLKDIREEAEKSYQTAADIPLSEWMKSVDKKLNMILEALGVRHGQ